MEQKISTKGRKTISKDGEKMRNRNFRATDAEWGDCLSFGGGSWIRKQINMKKKREEKRVMLKCMGAI